jgi:prepilin-type N-terminal cleavage/methylation domain-containing protein
MGQRGFTLIEMMVALGLTLSVAAVVSGALRFQSEVYVNDMKRIRVQQNLRSAMDIISMNVRQAGEGLDGAFPALLLSQKTTPVTSVLTVRRKTLHEVLLACKAISAGSTRIYVSDRLSATSDCLPANVAGGLSAWTTARTNAGGQLRIYLYDRVARAGEFLDFQSSGIFSSDDYLQVTSVKAAYPAKSTSLYVIEEYSFSLDTPNATLQLVMDGSTATPDEIAYNISNFKVGFTMQDGTTRTSLAATDTVGWKNIRAVTMSLTGLEKWRKSTLSRTLSAEYFPRNVLSQ